MPAPEPASPNRWTLDEITRDCQVARDAFRLRRLVDPKAAYEREFESLRKDVEFVVARLPDLLAGAKTQELLAEICGDDRKFMVLRYLQAPPISVDDLETLLDARLTPTALRNDTELAARLGKLLRDSLDQRRFEPFLAGRKPSAAASSAAKLATTVAAAIQRVQTERRSDEKAELEGSVRASLTEKLGFVERPRANKPIQTANFRRAAPEPGQFMREATLGDDNCDFLIGLWNNRLLALECKSSNSEINSRKRLNKEVVKNASGWLEKFGEFVVPGAMLRGVFKPEYVRLAQAATVAVFWDHRLEDLERFVAISRP
jgi:hypothetical protein